MRYVGVEIVVLNCMKLLRYTELKKKIKYMGRDTIFAWHIHVTQLSRIFQTKRKQHGISGVTDSTKICLPHIAIKGLDE